MDCAASNGPMQTITRRMGKLHRRKRRTTKMCPQFAAMRFGGLRNAPSARARLVHR